MIEPSLSEKISSSQLSAGNVDYIESLFEAFLADPKSVSDKWRTYFNSLPATAGDISHAEILTRFKDAAQRPRQLTAVSGQTDQALKQAHVSLLIDAYRRLGHHHAELDPLGLTPRHHIRNLELSTHHLTDADMNTAFETESPLTAGRPATLNTIITALKKTYSHHIGVEYMHISDDTQLSWLQHRFESVQGTPLLSQEKKKFILHHLTAAEGLEKYLASKYVGQKRFGLEGGESLIPMMQEIILSATKHNVKESIIGMAHRGRLNMLVNVLGKDPSMLFDEFEGRYAKTDRSGDVKYHMGFSSDIPTPHGPIHLGLAFNPSHLEIIAPVVEGSVRARQTRRNDLARKDQVVPIIIHGDSAFAGQGVVMETFNFSQARGYSTGGTIHIVINNQVGFTTSNPLDTRSTLYCTDVAKMVQAPIIHVNGDDPEAVIFAAQVAIDFRMQFKKDVVIDLVCYRRNGHNEADEPAVTQPKMYTVIRAMQTVREKYAQHLANENIVSLDESNAMVEAYRTKLDNHEALIEKITDHYEGKFSSDWSAYLDQEWTAPANTGIDISSLKEIGEKTLHLPTTLTLHPSVSRMMAERQKMLNGELPLNWGMAETLAYATLIREGYPVRLSGQDCGRGTFAHRHAALHDAHTDHTYVPLEHITTEPNMFTVIDSVLSEEAVLAFEYGFAASEPEHLVIWEAQFGDFVNGAQVVIDQFISSGEQKWGRLCGLVMMLPHGFEGQGPEHSSARLERFMQLCAQINMQVCVPTTPAQIFHLLRRQMIRPFRKPLIIMTPKSLLRHKLAISTLDELAKGEFQCLIPETEKLNDTKVRRVVLCTGKVYYDLLAKRMENKQDDVAIIRVEQLYPFPKKALVEQLKRYKKANDIVWCQEEPQNQGVWFSSQHNIVECLEQHQHLRYVGRAFSASPAVGSLAKHTQQQNALVDEALA